MKQAIDTFFKFNEGAIIRQVANASVDDSVDRIAFFHFLPWIGLSLFHTERKLLPTFVDCQNDNINFVANLDHFVRVVDSFGPGHFTNVNQTFDSSFELHKSTVAHNVDNFTFNLGINRISLFNTFPRIGRLLFHSQRDLFFLVIDLENHHFNFLINRNHFRRMSNTFPAHIGDMKQTIDSSQVYKGTEVCDILYDTLSQFAFRQFSQQRFTVRLPLTLDHRTTRNDNITSCFIDLENFAFDFLANVVGNIIRSTNIDLTGWQEYIHANINQ